MIHRFIVLPLLAIALLGMPALPAVTAPTVGYATYFGGNSDEWALAAATDAAGNLYLTGFTYSSDLKGAPSREPRSSDIFVTKLNPSGTQVIYTTIIGGGDAEQANAIAVDATGSAWVVGETASDDFPAIDAVQAEVPDPYYYNAFAVRLDPAGRPVFSSYLGSREGEARAVAIDSENNAVIGGNMGEAIVAKLDGETNDLIFGVSLTGLRTQPTINALALDRDDRMFITGVVKEQQLPTAGGLQPSCARFSQSECSEDAFMLRIAADGSAVTYGTYLGGGAANGGSGSDEGHGIAVGPDGSVYLAGETYAGDFPTMNAYQERKLGPNNFSEAFVTRLAPRGEGYALGYSTYLSGRGADAARSIAVDSRGNAYVTGYTGSLEFPAVAPLQPRLGNGVCGLGGSERNCYDPFITQLTPDGAVPFSSFFGGALDDLATDVVVGRLGEVFVVGHTSARDFPVSSGALQPRRALKDDGFIFRLGGGAGGGDRRFKIALPAVSTP